MPCSRSSLQFSRVSCAKLKGRGNTRSPSLSTAAYGLSTSTKTPRTSNAFSVSFTRLLRGRSSLPLTRFSGESIRATLSLERPSADAQLLWAPLSRRLCQVANRFELQTVAALVVSSCLGLLELSTAPDLLGLSLCYRQPAFAILALRLLDGPDGKRVCAISEMSSSLVQRLPFSMLYMLWLHRPLNSSYEALIKTIQSVCQGRHRPSRHAFVTESSSQVAESNLL